VNRAEVIERERRLARPVALLGFLAALLLVAGVIARLQVPNEGNAGPQLIEFSKHSGGLLASSILEAAGLLLAVFPLCYLFKAAAERNPRVRPGLIALCVVGPILFATQTVVISLALKSAGDDFVAQHLSEPSQSLKSLQSTIESKADSVSKVTVYNDANTAEVQTTNDDFYGVKKFPAAEEQPLLDSLDKAGIDTSEDSGGQVGDALANHLALDSSTYKLAGNLALPAGLTMIFAIVYPALQAFRIGLITRMFSTMGAIAAATLIILPLAPALIGVWLTWLGLTFLGRTPRGRPPAWDAGVAIPWPRPGQDPVPEPAIDGSAQELDPDAPLPANPPRQRGERRKRKSRE
jgi:hypothetical protein